MERKSRGLDLTPGEKIIIPAVGGLLTYPVDGILTVQVGGLSNEGTFSKVKIGAGCQAILIVLKKVG